MCIRVIHTHTNTYCACDFVIYRCSRRNMVSFISFESGSWVRIIFCFLRSFFESFQNRISYKEHRTMQWRVFVVFAAGCVDRNQNEPRHNNHQRNIRYIKIYGIYEVRHISRKGQPEPGVDCLSTAHGTCAFLNIAYGTRRLFFVSPVRNSGRNATIGA